MQLVKDKISVEELKKMSAKMFGNSVKAVVDIEQRVMVVDAEFHGEGQVLLLQNGSQEDHVWSINLYPYNFSHETWITFDSIMNIKPVLGNKSYTIENEQLRKKIIKIVTALVLQ